jgi:hypothetical protein
MGSSIYVFPPELPMVFFSYVCLFSSPLWHCLSFFHHLWPERERVFLCYVDRRPCGLCCERILLVHADTFASAIVLHECAIQDRGGGCKNITPGPAKGMICWISTPPSVLFWNSVPFYNKYRVLFCNALPFYNLPLCVSTVLIFNICYFIW